MQSLNTLHLSRKVGTPSVKRSLGMGLALAAAVSASAQTVTGTTTVTASLPFTSTDWTDNIVVPQFNNPLFHLDSVEVQFHGQDRGSVKLENRSVVSRDYSLNIAYSLLLSDSQGQPLLLIHPQSVSKSGTLGVYDGTTDYGGTSGVSFLDLASEDSGSSTLTASAAIAPFVGAGSVSLPVNALADAQINASANVAKSVRNESAADIKVLYHYSYTPAKVGDKVFYDANGDGVQQSTEKGVSGVTVRLLDKDGNGVATTATDGNGVYGFSGLVPGVYSVKFDLPAGAAFTSQGQGGDVNLDSDAGANGNTATFTLYSGDDRKDVDAGLVGLQSLGDRVWLDANGNGIQDNGEPGLVGIGVTLLDTAGNVLGTQSTLADGKYLFTGLLPGNYVVQFDPIGGYTRTLQGAGADRALDSDANVDGKTATVVLKAGDNRTDIDAGYKGALMLGDRVFFDANANGLQDANEVGIPDVKVSLLYANGAPVLDANGVAIADVTDSMGGYLFTDLQPGNYKVKFDKPSGYVFSGRDAGGDDTVDSDADGTGYTDVIALSQDNLNVDAGLYGTLTLGDRVWKDTICKNGVQDAGEPGVPGVKVTLLDKNGNSLGTTTTNANGLYSFTNLIPGDYTVAFEAPAGYGFTKALQGTNRSTDSNPDPTTGRASVSLSKDDLTIDAGLVGALKIGDTVFLDCDGDGVQDPNEKGIPNVRVYLWGDANNDGRVDYLGTTTTDKNGKYLFLGLSSGNYYTSLDYRDLPSNVVQTTRYGTNLLLVDYGALGSVDNLNFDFGFKPSCAPPPCHHKWWSCNPKSWSWDCLWIGGKCHTKTQVCAWMKRDDCGDKSICLYQRLCAAKLNLGNGCNGGKVYTCGKTTMCLKDAVKCADNWMATHPVGCSIKDTHKDWASICDVYAILDAHCNGR